jgi:signal transduction histidine kinase
MIFPRFRHQLQRLAAAFVIAVSLAVEGAGLTSGDAQVKVLALHFARRDSIAFAGVDEALRTALGSALASRLDYYSEFIDLVRFADIGYESAFSGYLRTRYAGERLDVVIATSPAVVEFLKRHPTLFPEVPLVYTTRAGVSAERAGSTGVVSVVDFKGTLAAAIAAQPRTKQVFVVSGTSAFDTLYRDIFKAQTDAWAGQLTFTDLAGLSLPQLLERVRGLPPNSVVFYVSVSEDLDGRRLEPFAWLESIAAASSAPIYSWHAAALGRGIVGGRVHSSVDDAQATARLALRVLNGERPESIPIAEIDSHSYQFDWRELQRWRISAASLPAGSVIRFRQPSFLEQYRWYVLGGAGLVTAQFLLIGGLLIQRARRWRTEEALRQSEARNTALLRAVPDLMFVHDRDGRFVDYLARDAQMLFVPPEAFLGRTIRDVMPSPLGQTFMDAFERACQLDEPVVVEYELPLDETRHFEARLIRADPGRVLSIIREITEAKRALDLNRALAGRLIESQEEERQRIARELHDDLGQRIALLNLEVDQLALDTSAQAHRSRLWRISEKAGEIASDLHHLSHRLHPTRLQTLGLLESVRLLCRDASQQWGLKVGFDADDLPDGADPAVSLCLYRIVQEALHNVAKHSRAREASVRISLVGTEIVLQVADSGIGFDAAAARSGLGLVSMRERVGALNGRLAIYAARGQGTRIDVRVPVKEPSIPLQGEPSAVERP